MAYETLIPGDRRGAAKTPPVHSRSRLLAIDCPRLAITITGWVRPISGPSFTRTKLYLILPRSGDNLALPPSVPTQLDGAVIVVE